MTSLLQAGLPVIIAPAPGTGYLNQPQWTPDSAFGRAAGNSIDGRMSLMHQASVSVRWGYRADGTFMADSLLKNLC